jgi:protein-S-isoprenylcysteine O-methyltransferase Ste14
LLWIGWIFVWIVFANFTLKMKRNEGLARLQHTVPTTLGLLLIFHDGPDLAFLSLGRLHDCAALAWFGAALTAAGQGFSIWARVHLGKYWSGTVALKEGHKIVSSGPYAVVRHPIYTGLLSAALGSALAAGTKEAMLGILILFPSYALKWRREEKLMLGEFGAEYEAYRKRTKAIIPYLL